MSKGGPDSAPVVHLIALIEAYMEETGARAAQVAYRAHVSPQAISKWRGGLKKLPDVAHLAGIARATKTPYPVVLEAALRDTGYLPHNGEVRGDGPPPIAMLPATKTPARVTSRNARVGPREPQTPAIEHTEDGHPRRESR